MKLASIIHNNSAQYPSKLISSLLKISPICSPVTSQKLSPLHFPLLNLGGCNYNQRYSAVISCLRKSEQGEESSTAETSSPQSHNGTKNIEMSHDTSAVDDSEERTQVSENYVSSVRTAALCVFSAVAFGVGVGFIEGVSKASEFFAGYLLEQSLSVDNLFVFVLIFKYFKVPLMYQNQVLSYGIAGAIIFRLSIILLGTATLQRFEAVNLLLAAILLYSSFKLFAEEEEDADLSDNFIVKTCQKFIPITLVGLTLYWLFKNN